MRSDAMQCEKCCFTIVVVALFSGWQNKCTLGCTYHGKHSIKTNISHCRNILLTVVGFMHTDSNLEFCYKYTQTLCVVCVYTHKNAPTKNMNGIHTYNSIRVERRIVYYTIAANHNTIAVNRGGHYNYRCWLRILSILYSMLQQLWIITLFQWFGYYNWAIHRLSFYLFENNCYCVIIKIKRPALILWRNFSV